MLSMLIKYKVQKQPQFPGGVIHIVCTRQNGKMLTPFPHRTHIFACYDPPLRMYSYSSDPQSPTSNGKLFKCPINNSIKKKSVKHLKERKISIAMFYK